MVMVVKMMPIDNDIDDNVGDKLRQQAAAVQLCQYFMSWLLDLSSTPANRPRQCDTLLRGNRSKKSNFAPWQKYSWKRRGEILVGMANKGPWQALRLKRTLDGGDFPPRFLSRPTPAKRHRSSDVLDKLKDPRFMKNPKFLSSQRICHGRKYELAF